MLSVLSTATENVAFGDLIIVNKKEGAYAPLIFYLKITSTILSVTLFTTL